MIAFAILLPLTLIAAVASPDQRPALIDRAGLADMLACSLSSVDRYRRLPDFPRPARLGSRTPRWRVAEVDEWITTRQ